MPFYLRDDLLSETGGMRSAAAGSTRLLQFDRNAFGVCAPSAIFWFCCAFFAVSTGCQDKNASKKQAVDHLVKAQQAIASGDLEAAREALTESITSSPTVWAYFERAKIYAKTGDDAAAVADCESGLALDPDNPDLKWILREVKKPKEKRFQGRSKNPPSHSK